MKLYTKISVILLFALFAGLTGCIKEEQYPVEPVIEYKSFMTDTAVDGKDSLGIITISYTDGDGNIGLNAWDTVEPRKYNYYLKFMQQINDQMVEVKPADTSLNFNARIPILTPAGRNKNIKGDIKMTIDLYFASELLQSDIIGFKIYIQDRDLNKSNTVTTPNFKIRK
jgi:hypothetical protein